MGSELGTDKGTGKGTGKGKGKGTMLAHLLLVFWSFDRACVFHAHLALAPALAFAQVTHRRGVTFKFFPKAGILFSMEDEELLSYNQAGFFPGPGEDEKNFRDRIAQMQKKIADLKEEAIPYPHWDWVRIHLREVFDFMPECLPAYYSNRSLLPWQAAASWIEGDRLVAIQLRRALRKGHFLRLYRREEILIHEVVHAARSAFQEDDWEEFFAYMTAEKRWRRVLGPIVKRPWEVWPFLIASLSGLFHPAGFLGAALWATLGFIRLVRGHATLRMAARHLSSQMEDPRIVRAILVRLSNEEIRSLARGETLLGDTSLRWRLIRLAYFGEKHDKTH